MLIYSGHFCSDAERNADGKIPSLITGFSGLNPDFYWERRGETPHSMSIMSGFWFFRKQVATRPPR